MSELVGFMYSVIIILIITAVVFFVLYFDKREEVLKLKKENEDLYFEKIREAKEHEKEKKSMIERHGIEMNRTINSVHDRVREIMKENEIKKLQEDHCSIDLEIQSSGIENAKIVSTYIFELKKRCKEKEIEIAVLEEENQELENRIRNLKQNMR
ncbi:MAG: hypothetical protein ACI3XQ_11440 [Eubacteriales bacterium]